MPIDLDQNLADLDAHSTHDASTAKLPEGKIEVVVDATDPERGFLTLQVKGLHKEEGRPLRNAFYAFYASYGDLLEHRENRRQELNPNADPTLDMITFAQLQQQFGSAIGKADHGLVTAATEIVQRCLTGYPNNEVSMKGQPLPYQTATALLDGKKLRVAHPRVIEAIRRSGLLVSVASACLSFSENGTYPSAAEQFAQGAKLGEEAAEHVAAFLGWAVGRATPFLLDETLATPPTPEPSPEPSASRSPSDDTSASESVTRSPEKLSA